MSLSNPVVGPSAFALFAMLVLSSGAVAQEVATYTGDPGFASVIRQGKLMYLAAGSRVERGETVITAGGNKTAALKMDDNTVIGLRQHSQFVVDVFQYRADEPAQDALVTRLVKGAFRAISGLIATRNVASVKYKTATATIGIRGTDFTARQCMSECSGGQCVSDCDDLGERAKDGLLVEVNQGQISVTNAAGTTDLSEGDTGYADADAPLVKTAPIPDFNIRLPASLATGPGC